MLVSNVALLTAPTEQNTFSTQEFEAKSAIRSQLGIGACVNFILRVSNASMHSFEKINRVSFSRRWVIGRASFGKILNKSSVESGGPRKLRIPFTDYSILDHKGAFSKFYTRLVSSHLWRHSVQTGKNARDERITKTD
ncbi:hypothetical protein Tco_1045565 [Tanacetum coccineum]|uniref:Uncharacterized protein n=1 Tax=Tanacetum coccineum TaxID=301880 RepID=A0ABQ5GUQ2_9ASTR